MSPHEERVCSITGAPFVISGAEADYLQRLSGINAHLGAPVPPRTVHSSELLRRNLAWGNLFSLQRTASAISKKPLLSRFARGSGLQVCSVAEFWDGLADNTRWGRPYDFNRPFFEQWEALLYSCVVPALNNTSAENSDYVNAVKNVRNCFLCFNCAELDTCLYCCDCFRSSDLVDCATAENCELCYSCVDIKDCYGCKGCWECRGSTGCLFCADLIGCSDCIGSAGLRNQRWVVFGRQLAESEYREFVQRYDLLDSADWERLRQEAGRSLEQHGAAQPYLRNCEDCSGAYLYNCKNAFQCAFAHGLHDCGYLVHCNGSKDSWFGQAFFSELSYCTTGAYSYNQLFCYVNQEAEAGIYTAYSFGGCSHCFGCVGLLKRSYCILNKQYTREEYFDMVPRIVRHMQHTKEWGRFFSPGASPISYPDSLASVYFAPLTAEQARNRGYRFIESPQTAAQPAADTIDPPTSLRDASDEYLLSVTLRCQFTKKPYNLQRSELLFYRRCGVPLPNRHWRGRLLSLIGRRPLLADALEGHLLQTAPSSPGFAPTE